MVLPRQIYMKYFYYTNYITKKKRKKYFTDP